MKLTWNMRLALIIAILRGRLHSITWSVLTGDERITVELVPTAQFKKRWEK